MQFRLAFLSYGAAQFLFGALSRYPFLRRYGVWGVFVPFMTGACVGGGVANANFKIGQDFRRGGESGEVRNFAMIFAGVGNFDGDALG
ncbi:hypothetical protein LX32DRAFT_691728 [Colletotrichum zoysiae]|uniref:Uncharacterized protein n=1 Tax=Colletotrichum zoysiae TaxID=1216348 RepID=A0AAD9HN31_9PEZI|nr:hypothetical protein LX32DRAFT_691728 [Colletotrichum zoysiae]